MSGRQSMTTRSSRVAWVLTALIVALTVSCTDDGEAEMAEFCAIAAESAGDDRWDDADVIVFVEPGLEPAESGVLAILESDAGVESLEVVGVEEAIDEFRDIFWDRPDLAEDTIAWGLVPASIRIELVDSSRPLPRMIEDHDDVFRVVYPDPEQLDLVWGDVLIVLGESAELVREAFHEPGLAGTLERLQEVSPEDLAISLDVLVIEARSDEPRTERVSSEVGEAAAQVAAAYEEQCGREV